MFGFLLFTFASSWIPAWILRDVWRADELPTLARFIVCPVMYAVTMGWQPLAGALIVRSMLEPFDRMDAGLRRSAPRWITLAVLLPLLAIAGATLLSELLQSKGLFGHLTLQVSPTLWALIATIAASTALLVVTYLQSLGEEIGWRGYFLVRTMELVGPWPGLICHGLAWALWYVPVVWIVGSAFDSSLLTALTLSVTCVLVGIVLGWLRLRSKSIIPPTIANAVFTLGAGLPFQLAGAEVGARGAVFQPVGWLPLLCLVLVLVVTPWRKAVVTPTA
jgi:membrane protease YdiL (CAAX protease family)